MTERPRALILGCGRMGTRRAKAILQSGVGDVVGVVDADHGRAKILGDSLDRPFSTDSTGFVDGLQPDAVFVCTPNVFHMDQAKHNLSKGRDIFCEKPLAMTASDAESVYSVSERLGRVVQVGSNLRWFGNVEKAKTLFDSGVIGKTLFVRGWIGHDGWVLREEPWSNDLRQIGGGTLLDNGHHMIDLLRWFLGDIRPVFGHGTRRLHPLRPPQEDNFFSILEAKDEIPIMIQSSWTEWNGYLYLEIYGEAGSICIDNRAPSSSTTLKMREKPAEVFDFSSEGPVSFARETRAFLDAVLGKRSPSPTALDGIRILQTIEELYQNSNAARLATHLTIDSE